MPGNARDAYIAASRAKKVELLRLSELNWAKYTDRILAMNKCTLSHELARIKQRRLRTRPHRATTPAAMEEARAFYAAQFQLQPFVPAQPASGALADDVDLASRRPELFDGMVPFDVAYVKELLSWMTNGKAPGPSGFITDLLHRGCASGGLSAAVYLLMATAWKTRSVPPSWKVGDIVMVPKPSGDKTKVSGFRPITLTETLRKVYERCVMRELLSGSVHAGNRIVLSPYQHGFRANHCTVDAVVGFDTAWRIRTAQLGRRPIAIFLDIKAAYDTVDVDRLMRERLAAGASEHMVGVLQSLFIGNRSRVLVRGVRSEYIEHTVGLWQGTILSPLL